MVTSEENMTNLHDAKTQVTVRDSGSLTGKKCGDCHGYQKYDGKLHCVALSDTDVIPGLHDLF